MSAMKKIGLILALAALAAVSCTSGKDAYKPGRKVGEIYVTAQSGAKTVLVSLEGLWRVIPREGWMSTDVNGREGEGAFTVYYGSNESDFVKTNATRRGALVLQNLKTMVADTLYIIQQGTPDGTEYSSAPQDSYVEFIDTPLTRVEAVYANIRGCTNLHEVAEKISGSSAQLFFLTLDEESAARFVETYTLTWTSILRHRGLVIVNKSSLPIGATLSGDAPAHLSLELDGIAWQVAEFDAEAAALPQVMALLESGFNRPEAGAKWVIGGSFYYLSVMEAGYPATPSWYPSDPDDEAFLADIYAQTNNLTDCIWMSLRGYNPTWTLGDRSWRADYVYASNQVWNAAVDVRLLDAPVSGASHKAVRLTIKY